MEPFIVRVYRRTHHGSIYDIRVVAIIVTVESAIDNIVIVKNITGAPLSEACLC